jgi:hypothetical protein
MDKEKAKNSALLMFAGAAVALFGNSFSRKAEQHHHTHIYVDRDLIDEFNDIETNNCKEK